MAKHKVASVFPSLYLLILTSLLSSCSSAPTSNDPRDPIENFNRSSWRFTWDYADKYVTKPLAESYVENVSPDVRTGIYNMALNLNEPATIINHLLQAKFTEAAKSAGRFTLNSTIGLLGFFDPASDFGWARHEEEFGEVLGSYGVGDGPYVVIPALGPTSVRDEVGDYVDSYYWPLAVMNFWPNLVRVSVLGLEKRAAIFEQETLITEAIDDYEFVKNAYFQSQRFKLYDGNPPMIVNKEQEAELDAYLNELESN